MLVGVCAFEFAFSMNDIHDGGGLLGGRRGPCMICSVKGQIGN